MNSTADATAAATTIETKSEERARYRANYAYRRIDVELFVPVDHTDPDVLSFEVSRPVFRGALMFASFADAETQIRAIATALGGLTGMLTFRRQDSPQWIDGACCAASWSSDQGLYINNIFHDLTWTGAEANGRIYDAIHERAESTEG